MTFSSLKAITLKPRKEKYLFTFLIAILTSAAFFIPYILMSEGYFTFYGDFNVQQIPFYKECHKAIREGNIFWNWNTDLGANFIGSYSFYLLGSPFFWLTLPFPNNFVPYLMGPLFILKFGCAALTAYCYIRRFTRTPEAASLGGILYAFSGFSVYNIFFNHFHEPLIFFPLLLLSMEQLITENRRFGFALAVFLCAVCNYFFFFGMVIFCIIYFFVKLLSGAYKIRFSRFIALVAEAVLGVSLSAFVLFPSILAIMGNGRVSEILLGWDAIFYGKESIYGNVLQCFFFPPDIPARPVFFPEAEVKWSSLGGWLPLFSMVGVFTFFAKRKNHWLKRLIGILVFMALVPILNCSFYGFNTSYYARWYYMPILMMSLATVTLTEDREIDWSFGYKWVLGITLAVSAVIGFFPQRKDDKIIFGIYTQGNNKSEWIMYAGRFFASCAIAIASLIVLKLLLKTLKQNRKNFYKSALACVCIISIIYGNVFIACGRSHSYKIKEVVIDQLIEGKVDLGDKTQFRVDVYDGVDNTSMFLGLSGINAFHSIVPSSIMDFYEYIGVKRDVASRPETDVYAIRPLLSVKYLLDRKNGNDFIDDKNRETKMTGYKYLKTESGYYIYENENYIPYGFSYDYYMDYEFCNGYSEKERANLMLKAMLLTQEQIKKYGYMFENIADIGDISYNDDGSEDKTLLLTEDSLSFDCEKLAKTSASSFETDNRGFTATVERDKDSLVFFSVPFDKGWTATVNGVKTDIEKVNVGFMAVKVSKGLNEIRFSYTTPGLANGLIITTLSAAVLLIYVVIFTIWSRKRVIYNNYPEGDSLIIDWKNAELLEEDETEQKETEYIETKDLEIPKAESGFEGGFKINTDIE